MSNNNVYYKLYLTPGRKVTVVCMQWFDEYDYNPLKFYKDSSGEPVEFKTEEEAVAYLNEHFNPMMIDPEYITPNNLEFLKQ